MKKLFLTLGIAALFMTACNNNTPAETEAPAEDTIAVVVEEQAPVCPMAELKGEFDNWANLDEVAQTALVTKAIELFTAEAEQCCKHEGEEAHECEMEMTEEMKAECEAMKAKMEEWKAQFANIATMTLEEQKDLIMARFEMMKPCCKHAAEEAAPVEEEAPVQ